MMAHSASILKSIVNCQLSVARKTKGFTLIELLVVISIISILAAASIVSYNSAQERGRDARRKSDLDAIKKALELAKQDTAGAYYYPSCSPTAISCGASSTTPTLATTYIKAVPTDPKTNANYTYIPTPANCSGICTSYSLVACLENTNDSQRDAAQPGGSENETVCPGTPVSYTVTPN